MIKLEVVKENKCRYKGKVKEVIHKSTFTKLHDGRQHFWFVELCCCSGHISQSYKTSLLKMQCNQPWEKAGTCKLILTVEKDCPCNLLIVIVNGKANGNWQWCKWKGNWPSSEISLMWRIRAQLPSCSRISTSLVLIQETIPWVPLQIPSSTWRFWRTMTGQPILSWRWDWGKPDGVAAWRDSGEYNGSCAPGELGSKASSIAQRSKVSPGNISRMMSLILWVSQLCGVRMHCSWKYWDPCHWPMSGYVLLMRVRMLLFGHKNDGGMTTLSLASFYSPFTSCWSQMAKLCSLGLFPRCMFISSLRKWGWMACHKELGWAHMRQYHAAFAWRLPSP